MGGRGGSSRSYTEAELNPERGSADRVRASGNPRAIDAGGRPGDPGYDRGVRFAEQVYANNSLDSAETIMRQRYSELQGQINAWGPGSGISRTQAQMAMDEQNAIRNEMWDRGRATPRR